ncbi:holo-ACP synthase [Phenylobacterium deserti]|uniref:Holo-[acyl-carrier-protein] synthase n=1 Tax=Phenylobacterium deserti TaxID=1914756 RepID=A0A328ADX1_9CAUL|nr:holo-ACP synthase [Phenylobacterium deserti]RAK50948.1 holo-ACP synthase [Phenylobacterium deserti]
MIIGIGSDLSDIRRIEASLQRFGDRFTHRVFTDIERARSERKPGPAASYAKRFAAKEACAKALGTGMRDGVFWRDMGVVNMRSGQPTMALTGGALVRLHEITPPGMKPVIHLSLTDDHPYAQAFVIIEALPADAPA